MTPSSVGQLILCGIPGTQLDPATARILRDIQPGGFILFTRNIENPSQLRKLTDDLRDLSRTEPIITIDQEGGRVARLKQIGNEPPNANQLRDKADPELIKAHGELTAESLRLFGFNLNLCPVLDISFDDAADNSLKGRCYGNTPEQVIANASIFHEAMKNGGIPGCGKHFPGYSRAPSDAHHAMPVVNLTRDELERDELKVFRHFAPTIDSMMIGHAAYPHLDPGTPDASGNQVPPPTSLSKPVITGLLRETLAYRGLVMTDDLDMGATLDFAPFDDTIRMTLSAGNDLAMICHRLESVRQARDVIDRCPPKEIERAQANVHGFKRKMSPPSVFSEEKWRRIDEAVWRLRVAALGHETASKRSAEDGKRSPVETY